MSAPIPPATGSTRSDGRTVPFRLSVRRCWPDLLAGVLFAALVTLPYPWDLSTPGVLSLALAAASIALRRLAPSGALVLAWATGLAQFWFGERPSLVQVATLVVLYSAAAYGSRTVVRAAAVSAVLGGAIAAPYLILTGARYAAVFGAAPFEQRVLIALLPLAVLGSSWLAGWAVRVNRSNHREVAQRSIAEERAERAIDVAEVERVRAEVARDVHDVVGHSLAVIIAQADAAELTDEPERVRAMIHDIGRTARASLDEVRAVLSRTVDPPADHGETGLDEVIEGVRATTSAVDDVVTGEPRPLPNRTAEAARRILQEMFTNALRHGRPGGRIAVSRDWRPSALILEVANTIAEQPQPGGGSGLDGMRTRLAEVGGSLETDVLDGVFVARARIPAAEGPA